MAKEIFDLSCFPRQLLDELNNISGEFRDDLFCQEYQNNPAINSILINLDNHFRTQKIYVYHYTNAARSSIQNNGLLIRSVDDLRASFLDAHQKKFDKDQILRLRKCWDSFDKHQDLEKRDNKIFFVFHGYDPDFSNVSDLDNMLQYYGGEAISFGLEDDEDHEDYRILTILKNIGEPMVLKCSVLPENLTIRHDYPFGHMAISAFHEKKCNCHFEISQSEAVPIKDIEIISVNNNLG